jgi:transcriptional regulator with XRE-family HTH domain
MVKVATKVNKMADLAFLIGKRIREIRKRKGLRQEDVEALGISTRYFQKIETGRANVTLKTLEKIASALEINPTELFIFPLDLSPEADRLVAMITEFIKNDDERITKKLNILIREILM